MIQTKKSVLTWSHHSQLHTFGSVMRTVKHFDISELKMESNGAYEASQPKWTSCLHTCPSAEQRAASGIQRDGEMSPKPMVPCLNLVSALCLDEVCLDRR